MMEWQALRIDCDSEDSIVAACNKVVIQLPPEVRKKFVALRTACLARGGVAEMLAKLNGRTVAEALKGSDETLKCKPISEGQHDGIRFELYEKDEQP